MSIQKSINIALASFIALLGLAFLLVTMSVSAQEAEPETTAETTQVDATEEESAETTTEASEEESNGNTYDYVAQPGDSYSLMVRKAVQTYGVNNSVNLSGAQIIYAETNLTQEAGSPILNLGDNVSIAESAVQKWVESAQSLTEEQQAAWQPYANGANFNTNAVGEAPDA